ncbi:MAG: type II secretion system F family protein [Sedimentisphaerales bacterium]|nr:type II secretion system F family protein [Sedimentisphaerales bacterium]
MSNKRANIYHNLATMLDAGLPILRALQTCASGLRGRYASTFEEIREKVKTGQELSTAMQAYPWLFAPLDRIVVQAGEQSGSLAESCAHLARWYEFIGRMKSIILSGLLLPLLLIHMAALVGPIPRFALGGLSLQEYLVEVFMILLFSLYIPCAIVLLILSLRPGKIGNRLIGSLPVVGPAVLSALFSFDSPLRRLFDAVLLHLPVLGKAVKQLCLSRFCRVFHILYDAGVPVLQTMELAAKIAGNAALYHQLIGGLEAARHGDPISAGFSPALPDDFRNLWQVGEETGDLDDVTGKLAEMTGFTAELYFEQLARWLPRLVYIYVCIIMITQIFAGFQAISSAGSGLISF